MTKLLGVDGGSREALISRRFPRAGRIAAASSSRFALILFFAMAITSAPLGAQSSYGVTFQSVSLNASNTNVSPGCTSQFMTTTSAPVLFSSFVPATQVVKTDNGWSPFVTSSPYGTNGAGTITASLSANGIATTVAVAPAAALGLPSYIDSGTFAVFETIDLNTGLYTSSSIGNYVDELDGCTGIAYVNETDPNTGMPYAGPQNVSFSASDSGVVGVTLAPVTPQPFALAVSNPYSCSVSPANCSTIPGTSVAGGSPAWAIAADGQSAALLSITSSDTTDDIQITLSTASALESLGSLSTYDPNFLDDASQASLNQTFLELAPDSSCSGQSSCTFFALLWAPDGLSGNAGTQPVPLTLTVSQGTATPIQSSINLVPPPLVLVHGIWANANNTWPDFEQWLQRNYPYSSSWIWPADYGLYNYLAYSYPKTQAVLEFAIADALSSAVSQGTVARLVDVVAHSMGGLVTRYFMANGPPFPVSYLPQQPIHQLITIGTPHSGTPLASVLWTNWNAENGGGNAWVNGVCGLVALQLGPCTLNNLFSWLGDNNIAGPLSTGVQSLQPGNQPPGSQPYNSIVGDVPHSNSPPNPGSCAEWLLDQLISGFFPSLTDYGILRGYPNDTLVPGTSQSNGAEMTAPPISGVVHVNLCPWHKDVGETESPDIWNQAAHWLMGGSGPAPAPVPGLVSIPRINAQSSAADPLPVNLAGYTQIPASNVTFSPASGSILTINSSSGISAASSTKNIVQTVLIQNVVDPTDAKLLYSNQAPFLIPFVPTRMGSATFVAFAVFDDKTYATTTLNYTFQPPGTPLALNLVNAPVASLPVGASATVKAQALFSNGSVDVSQAATYMVRSGAANVMSVMPTGILTANGPGVDWLDVTYDGLTVSAQVSVGSCTFSLSPANQLIDVGGGSAAVQVTTETGCAWTAQGQAASWVTITNASGTGSGTVTATAAPNTTGVTQKAIISLPGQNVAITQPASSCTYGINNTSISVPAGGGSGSLGVTTSCQIVASSTAGWITVTTVGSAVNYGIAPNTLTTQRTGTIIVGTQAVSVTESAAMVPLAELSTASVSFGDENIGTTSGSQPVMLSNKGTAALAVNAIATSAKFKQTNTCGSSIAPGGNCTIDVAFSPAVEGAAFGALTITDTNGGAVGSIQEISLTGNGVVPPLTRGWAWTGGSTTLGGKFSLPGVYGAIGIPAPGNIPGGRMAATGSSDAVGDLWMFGGSGSDSAGESGLLNDLWQFNALTQDWTWMSGSSTLVKETGGQGFTEPWVSRLPETFLEGARRQTAGSTRTVISGSLVGLLPIPAALRGTSTTSGSSTPSAPCGRGPAAAAV